MRSPSARSAAAQNPPGKPSPPETTAKKADGQSAYTRRMAKRKKMAKATIKKAHKIAQKIAKSGSARNPFAVGTAVAKRQAAKRKRKR